ncbi:hypothetical protein D3C84_567150 [compost metagenome]
MLTYTPSLYILYEVAPATAVQEKFITEGVALVTANPAGTAGSVLIDTGVESTLIPDALTANT